MEKGFLLKMEKCMMAIFHIIKWMDMEYFNCKTDKDIRVNGFKTKKMAQEFIPGLMEAYIKEFM